MVNVLPIVYNLMVVTNTIFTILASISMVPILMIYIIVAYLYPTKYLSTFECLGIARDTIMSYTFGHNAYNLFDGCRYDNGVIVNPSILDRYVAIRNNISNASMMGDLSKHELQAALKSSMCTTLMTVARGENPNYELISYIIRNNKEVVHVYNVSNRTRDYIYTFGNYFIHHSVRNNIIFSITRSIPYVRILRHSVDVNTLFNIVNTITGISFINFMVVIEYVKRVSSDVPMADHVRRLDMIDFMGLYIPCTLFCSVPSHKLVDTPNPPRHINW